MENHIQQIDNREFLISRLFDDTLIQKEFLESLPGRGSRRVSDSALRTISNILSNGRLTSSIFPWSRLKARHITYLRGALAQKGYKNRTVNRFLSTCKSIMRVSFGRGLITADEWQRASFVRGLPTDNETRGRRLSAGEIKGLFDACGSADGKRGVRDAAILSLGYGGGHEARRNR